jgi:carbonic anhydrase
MHKKCRIWISTTREKDPEYFSSKAESQKPQYMWLGCSDARTALPAATGLSVDDIFVHTNLGNLFSHHDKSAMGALEYSVKVWRCLIRICRVSYWCRFLVATAIHVAVLV